MEDKTASRLWRALAGYGGLWRLGRAVAGLGHMWPCSKPAFQPTKEGCRSCFADNYRAGGHDGQLHDEFSGKEPLDRLYGLPVNQELAIGPEELSRIERPF